MTKLAIDVDDHHQFRDNLFLKLELESDGKKVEVYSSNIEKLDLECSPFGYDGSLHISSFENEELDTLMNSKKPITLTFSYQCEKEKIEKKDPTIIKGVVKKKPASKIFDINQTVVIVYLIEFSDVAKEQWSQHFTKAVHIEKTMKDVIDAEKTSEITIEYDWDTLTEEHPMLSYDLKNDRVKPEETVSFYDFLMWYLQLEGGVLEYSYKEDQYKILKEKSSDGEPTKVNEWLVTSPKARFPEIPRHAMKTLKSYPDRLEVEDEENANGFPQVVETWFDEATLWLFQEQCEEQSKSPFYQEMPEVTLWVKEFQEDFQFDQIFPGTLLKFRGWQNTEGQWSDHPTYKDKIFRIRKTKISVRKLRESQPIEISMMPYECEIEIVLEEKDEPFVPRHVYRSPRFPFETPGEVFCDIGKDEQTTFNVKENDKVKMRVYQVKVPLSGEEEKYVIAPYNPDYLPGHFYFPSYKKQQVMLSMRFKTAKISRFLNHQPLTELPQDDQACQFVFASNGSNEYIFLKHEYEKGSESVFTIKQSSTEKQTQVITIKKKETEIVVEEKEKRTTKVLLNRDTGLLVEVDDKTSKIKNSSLYTDKEIKHTSKGDDGTSTITQTPTSIEHEADTVTTKCKDFVLDAEKSLTLKVPTKLLMETPLVKATEAMQVS